MEIDCKIDHEIDREIDRDFVLRCLQDLVRIDSRNPGLVEGAPGEGEAARYVAARLGELGWSPELQDCVPTGDRGGAERVNVLARRRGRGDGPSLMINVHLDTVGTEGMDDPFSGELRQGRVWGRGAQDIKGGAAAALGMARALGRSGTELGGDVVLAFVADEENASLGTERLVKSVRTDAAIVLEPSELDVCVAHRGFGVYRLRTRGRVAHGGSSAEGVDANLHMVHLLAAVDGLRRRWERELRHQRLGSATLHVPRIEGGSGLFVYAGECTAHVECRTVPGQTEEGVLAELRAASKRAAANVRGLRASVETVQWREPFEAPAGSPLLATVEEALEAVRGEPPRRISHSWWEDSALLAAAGMDTLVLGPVGGGLHTAEEWVDVESVFQLAAVLYRSALGFCGSCDRAEAGRGHGERKDDAR